MWFKQKCNEAGHFEQNGTARPNLIMAESQARIEALSKSNYETWKLQMEAVLIKNNRFKYVSEVAPAPEPKETYASWLIEDSKTKTGLILCIQPSELKLVTMAVFRTGGRGPRLENPGCLKAHSTYTVVLS
ncbi:hypothetical protein AVEN_118356-1 [Araneus ventricosus]|uniref:DUF4219 domain-containing protein n=1 Tax=Araneus ventricosus TaxID=182803 RepID=A0A4Y2B8P3_ARAVE|nr:hypothetical protein AVEN_118356-1 [Araneus ventricosus]